MATVSFNCLECGKAVVHGSRCPDGHRASREQLIDALKIYHKQLCELRDSHESAINESSVVLKQIKEDSRRMKEDLAKASESKMQSIQETYEVEVKKLNEKFEDYRKRVKLDYDERRRVLRERYEEEKRITTEQLVKLNEEYEQFLIQEEEANRSGASREYETRR